MLSTDCGITSFIRSLQYWNAFLPTVFSPSGRITSEIPVLQNASSPISVSDDGILTFFISVR